MELKVSLPDPKKIGDAFRAERAKALADASAKMEQIVRGAIGSSGIQQRTGALRSWQTVRVSKGYAAVSPIGGGGANGPGAITNYLESGHTTRKPSGRAKVYRPRFKQVHVKGYGFYAASKSPVQALQEAAGKAIADAVAAKLQGGALNG